MLIMIILQRVNQTEERPLIRTDPVANGNSQPNAAAGPTPNRPDEKTFSLTQI